MSVVLRNLLIMCCLLCGVVGCAQKSEIAKLQPILNKSMEARGAVLKEAVSSLPVCGVMVFAGEIAYNENYVDIFVKQMIALGVNRLYLNIETQDELSNRSLERINNLFETVQKSGIKCEIVLQQRNFIRRKSGSVLVRYNDNKDLLLDAINRVVKFFSVSERVNNLSGITVAPEIHRFTLEGEDLPANALYIWSDEAYGLGQDNDMLMQRSMKHLKECKAVAGDFEFNVAIPAFYHDRVEAGDLSCGRIEEFLSFSSRVILLGEGSKPSEYRDSFLAEFDSAKDMKNRVIMGLQFASHAAGEQDRLRRRNWDDFINIAKYLSLEGKKHSAFGGVLFAPWNILVLLWEN